MKSNGYFKHNNKIKKYHKTRTMFCIFENKVYIADKKYDFSHYEWFKKIWILNDENWNKIMENTTRWYIWDDGDVWFYIWFNFEINDKSETEFFNYLKKLNENYKLNLEWNIYWWVDILKIWESWKPRKIYWKVKNFINI